MATGRKEWKETGEELGGAFVNLAKSLIRTGAAGVKEVEAWAEDDGEKSVSPEKDCQSRNDDSTVFNDGTWRETGKGLGQAFRNLGGTIMGSIERGADKAEEWAGDAREAMNSTVENAADKAERAADNLKHGAGEFAEGLRESDEENKAVADAEIISEEIIE